MRIVAGSSYLNVQEAKYGQAKKTLGVTGIVYAGLSVLTALVVTLLYLFGVVSFVSGLVLMAGSYLLLAFAWWVAPKVDAFKKTQANYRSGAAGEEYAAETLGAILGPEWTLFRNVLLPDGQGDIDGVLTGPNGVFALEIKTFSGIHRVEGGSWSYRKDGRWVPAEKDPGRQAKRNATRLGKWLDGQGQSFFVMERVVWAGKGELDIRRPSPPVWIVRAPVWIERDVRSQKSIAPPKLEAINRLLATIAHD